MIKAKKRIFLTGATGFVGSHIARKLLSAGAELHATCRMSSDLWRLSDCKKSIFFHTADLESEEEINRALGKAAPDIVIHCAGYGIDPNEQDRKKLLNVNINSTLFLMRAAAKHQVKRVIHTGSCSEFASSNTPITESAPLLPSNFYGVTKAAASILAAQQSKELGLDVVVLRLFNLYGPYESKTRLIPAILSACFNRQPLALTGGEQIRDYTYIEDVATLYASLAFGSLFPAGHAFHIGSGSARSVKEIGEMVASLAGNPNMLNWGVLPYRANDPKSLTADVSKAKNLLGWSSQTPLEAGIQKMINSYKAGIH